MLFFRISKYSLSEVLIGKLKSFDEYKISPSLFAKFITLTLLKLLK